MLDYEILRIIWWVLVVVLLIGFSVTDGFDMGVTALLPVAGKKEVERRIMINSIAPHWDGNQVWLLTAGGAIFAAWPIVYSVAFSGFYIALFLVLAALFFRPIGFEYRAKIDNPTWRAVWDWVPLSMARCTLSLGILFSAAFSKARRRRGLAPGSPPPMRAATVISLIKRVKILPRLAS